MRKRPSAYERRAYHQIQVWKKQTSRKPEPGGFRRRFDHLGERIKDFFERRRLYRVIQKALAGTVGLLGDAAAWSVRPKAVYSEFRKKAHDVERRTDIFKLDLEQVDDVASGLDTKYKSLGFGEGAVTGAAGAPGLVTDIPALITLNLRAIGEHATYYGFDVASQRERFFAMQVLILASSWTDAEKVAVMAELARIGKIATKVAWKELEKSVIVKTGRQVSRSLSIRLTKKKLAQAVPVIGAAVGSGFNAYYTNQVCDAAYHLYRERFLTQKYRADAWL